VILDAAPFTSARRLKDMLEVLAIVKQDIQTRSVALTVPSYLFYELEVLLKARKPTARLVEIFRAWLPIYSEDYIDELLVGLTSREYLESLDTLFREFHPYPANKYVGELEQVGEGTLRRKALVEHLGHIIGEIVFEILAVSYILKALIVTFGERLAKLAHRVGVAMVKIHSRYKEELRQRAHIRRMLRLMGYVLTFEVSSSLLNIVGELPVLHNHSTDIGLGLIIVADG
jgi:hypothetical protein